MVAESTSLKKDHGEEMIKWKNCLKNEWNCSHMQGNDSYVLLDHEEHLTLFNTKNEPPKGYFRWVYPEDVYPMIDCFDNGSDVVCECPRISKKKISKSD